MGVVHYRYRSGVQTFSVQVPGAFASVADLKRLIAATGRHGTGRTRGRGPRDGIALCDPRTGEGEALHLEVDMTVDSWVIIMASHWKGRHPLLAMSAAFVTLLDISLGIAHQGRSPLHLAISAINVEFQGTLFILAQIMVTGNIIPEEPVH
nr:unnamed protein product [Digitaria exilis]